MTRSLKPPKAAEFLKNFIQPSFKVIRPLFKVFFLYRNCLWRCERLLIVFHVLRLGSKQSKKHEKIMLRNRNSEIKFTMRDKSEDENNFNFSFSQYSIIVTNNYFIIDVMYSQLNNSLVQIARVCTLQMASTRPMWYRVCTLPMASTQPMCQLNNSLVQIAGVSISTFTSLNQ